MPQVPKIPAQTSVHFAAEGLRSEMKTTRVKKLISRCVGPRRKSGRDSGFTLIEVLVAGLVMVVGVFALAGFFTTSASRVLDSSTRSLLT